MISTVTIM